MKLILQLTDHFDLEFTFCFIPTGILRYINDSTSTNFHLPWKNNVWFAPHNNGIAIVISSFWYSPVNIGIILIGQTLNGYGRWTCNDWWSAI